MVQVNVITAAPTGINDATITTNSIRCYPNPVTGILTVETGDEKRLEKIIIYSIEGKKVDEEIIQGKTQKINIPLNTLSNGVYILDCVFEKSSQKIMILKQ